ncbi:flagellar motor switch protein FliM [Meinhardsimonia xiamenensis]|jgi:flagellar motor switch protein FliM|uniref:Flagellar motor switch protein FliM n=1 Tax=Meinhardsimonia xiamenensis TaxID=990712 RepID=A0A1G9BJP6_9RHOB|nr:FliM/FliN family flagellar motor C-terminal domain-containing protein [Meinhardsimonia xiamenensis]PRX34952.1 flagellar motor switch protein FliM [Meinhardsimonia xiamenensis]SDK39749.1 flagellar motor switch protein FliM [Meinhardsimonia xiamenensis]
MSLLRALELAFAQAALREFGIELAVTGLGSARLLPEALVERLPSAGLIAMLEAADGRRGLVAFCPQLLAAVVEAATVGAVQPGEAPERRATTTDAAMASGLVNGALQLTAVLGEGLAEASEFAGLSMGALRADARSASLCLRERAHHLHDLSLDAGRGARAGRIVLVLPPPDPPAEGRPCEERDWRPAFERAVCDGTVRLEAVLARLSLPLARVEALTEGEVLPLDGARLDAVELVGADGAPVAAVRLGRVGERKAVRLLPAAPGDPAGARGGWSAAGASARLPGSDKGESGA